MSEREHAPLTEAEMRAMRPTHTLTEAEMRVEIERSRPFNMLPTRWGWHRVKNAADWRPVFGERGQIGAWIGPPNGDD